MCTGEEFYQSWDGREDDFFMVEVSVSRGTRRTYDPTPPSSPAPLLLQLLSETFPGLVESRLGWNGLDPCHAFLRGCVLPVGLLVSNPGRGSEGAGPGCCCRPVLVPVSRPGRLGWRRRWVVSKRFAIISKHLLLFFLFLLPAHYHRACLRPETELRKAPPISSVGFVFVVSFPPNLCSCWLCGGADWSSCSSHLTSCRYTETQDISDDSEKGDIEVWCCSDGPQQANSRTLSAAVD